MRSAKGIMFKAAALFVIGLCVVLSGQTVHAAAQSQQVAYVGSTYSVYMGGCFPTTGAFSAFIFHLVPRVNLNLANLGPGGVCGTAGCDTLVLNVSSAPSAGLACNINANLTAAQKADILTFVQNGGKVIIYDSECSAQNYSWLPYPFTTNNPGARGARGTLTIVEENALSTTNPLDSKYINDLLLENNTDAIGDMNVMTTRDPGWCLDMSGTNINQVTGPVHTYARYGNGLFIYNGMDVDNMACGTVPAPTNGPGNLAKVWLQELQVPFNPTPIAALPCGVTVVGITLTPMTATNVVGTPHTVIAKLTDLLNNPQPGITVTFTVTAGPNAGVSGTAVTDVNGQAAFSYTSAMIGTDQIEACFTNQAGVVICSQTATKTWIAPIVCDVDKDTDIDQYDLSLISRSRGQTAPFGDLRDSDGNGLITPNDVKVCIPRCTRPNCAVQ